MGHAGEVRKSESEQIVTTRDLKGRASDGRGVLWPMKDQVNCNNNRLCSKQPRAWTDPNGQYVRGKEEHLR